MTPATAPPIMAWLLDPEPEPEPEPVLGRVEPVDVGAWSAVDVGLVLTVEVGVLLDSIDVEGAEVV